MEEEPVVRLTTNYTNPLVVIVKQIIINCSEQDFYLQDDVLMDCTRI